VPHSHRAKHQIWRVEAGQIRRKSDQLVVEEPLEIRLRAGMAQNTLAVTMRTPGNDYELAAGFLYSEGVVTAKEEIQHMIYCVDGNQSLQQYNVLRVHLRHAELPDLPHLNRYFLTNSACGVCGSTMLDDLDHRLLLPLPAGPVVDADLITTLPATLRSSQAVFDATGGLHAAALFTPNGELLAVREDVGRHNALDKLTGWGLLQGHLPFHDKIVLVSGRASYELLQKCRVAGVSIFCAISAPSTLAVELATRFGITLVAFLRDNRFNIYSHPERIGLAPAIAATSPATTTSVAAGSRA
jgi:FdhD protein